MSAPILFSKIYLSLSGESTHGKPPIVVMLHGWGFNHAVWAQTAQYLSSEPHRLEVHCIDLPGHGKSAELDGWKRPKIGHLQAISEITLEQTIDALFTYISALAQPVALMGWSLGGLIAMQFALQYPKLVSKLVLVSSTPCFQARNDWAHAMAAQTLADFSQRLQANQAGTIRSFLCLQMLNLPNAKSVAQTLSRQLQSHGEASANALTTWLSVLEHTDIRAEIHRLAATPMLIVQGGRDMLVPVACGDFLNGALPHAQYLRIDSAAHAPFISHAAIFETHLSQFLNSAPA